MTSPIVPLHKISSHNRLRTALSRHQIASELAQVQDQLESVWRRHLGYPGTADVNHTQLAELLTQFAINNLGDPFVPGTVPNHTKPYERDVLELCAALLRAPAGGWWGYIAHGGTEATMHALSTARCSFPEAIVLRSAAAHASVAKNAALLRMPSAVVATSPDGQMDYRDLAAKLAQYRHRRPVIVATIGSTMTESIDDLHRIVDACDAAGVHERFIHSDAALSGLPLAMFGNAGLPGFDLADGADSIAISGHKFLSTLMPCSVYMVKSSWLHADYEHVDYIGGPDRTISGSRNGHLALLLWSSLAQIGADGLSHRAARSRYLAAYAVDHFNAAGIAAWRSHPHAFTVVFPAPSPKLARRWSLPVSGGLSHLICMPGVTQALVDELADELSKEADLKQQVLAKASQ